MLLVHFTRVRILNSRLGSSPQVLIRVCESGFHFWFKEKKYHFETFNFYKSNKITILYIKMVEMKWPAPPTVLHPWIPQAFGLRILASLVSVNDIFCKNLFQIFSQKSLTQFTIEYKIDYIWKAMSRTKKTYEHKNPLQKIAYLLR